MIKKKIVFNQTEQMNSQLKTRVQQLEVQMIIVENLQVAGIVHSKLYHQRRNQ